MCQTGAGGVIQLVLLQDKPRLPGTWLAREFHSGGCNGTLVSPSGLWPDGRLRATIVEGHGFGNSMSGSVPVGESPTGTGGSPGLPMSGGNDDEISGLGLEWQAAHAGEQALMVAQPLIPPAQHVLG